ncbi:MAG: response regulator [Acidobacteria bacterium]|jgi:CheY-like chemotaxis protein|nr:response regulator [Acidobacteriota bacterium]
MPKLLLVEDDPDQLEIRTLILEQAGHAVYGAASGPEALALARAEQPSLVVMDLRLPRTADGIALITALRTLTPAPRIVVLSGWTADLAIAPDVDAVLSKPVRTPELIHLIARLSAGLLFFCLLPLAAATLQLNAPAEVLAEITAPVADWQTQPKIADLLVNGEARLQLPLVAPRQTVFLGRLPAGRHEVTLANATVRLTSTTDPVHLHAPVLFERKNAIGRFTDVPLLTYAEWLNENGQRVLQYSVIFSNEDGGTSTRFLMARWGRTTDIEFVYKVYFRPDGSKEKAIIQGRGHRDMVFTGPFANDHPLLMPVTDNNMVAGEGPSAVRYQPAATLVDLRAASRESVMDQAPFTWQAMTKELLREGKLRDYGVERGEDISDPRHYLYLEFSVRNRLSRVAAMVQLRNEAKWRLSHFGVPGAAIERDGWVRTTIELPPGTRAADVTGLGLECLAGERARQLGQCEILSLGKAFFLGADMLPAEPFFRSGAHAPIPLRVGEAWTWTLNSK